jgi:hypothetical protein
MRGNQFKIAGGESGAKVSWQVTGIRQDRFAQANRIPVEEDKRAEDRGLYLHPEAWGLGSDQSIAPRFDAEIDVEVPKSSPPVRLPQMPIAPRMP